MAPPQVGSRPAVPIAMLCAAGVGAQFVAGKAVRDALYLHHLDATTLPTMVVATAAFSILLVALSSKAHTRAAPGIVIPAAFGLHAVLLLGEWAFLTTGPVLTAQAIYLHISGLGPMLGSGFWLIATDCFDPRTAKKRFGQIAGFGTLGGLLGGLVAERMAVLFGVAAILPVLSLISLFCAWQIRRLALTMGPTAYKSLEDAPDLLADSPRSGLRVLSDAPYLRNLAALVLLGTCAATLVDYVFKVEAVAALGRGDDLLRFFALYYAGTSLLTFAIQTTAGELALTKLGIAVTTSTPSLAVVLGGLGGLAAPGLLGAAIVRGGESVFRASLFRAGYELFYTPIPSSEKRAAKTIIDVGFDRLGDALGGSVIPLVLILASPQEYVVILSVAVACSVCGLALASRLNRGYIQTLERSLLNRAVELDLTDASDATTRSAMLRTLQAPRAGSWETLTDAPAPSHVSGLSLASADVELQDIVALRSRDRRRIVEILRREEPPLSAVLAPHVIVLLAWDPVAEDAVTALRRVADARIGMLVDALVDPNQPFAVRRRIARLCSACTSQRAVEGLFLGLEDLRFEVRYHCGRSLFAIASRNPDSRIERERTFDVVRREVAVGKPVWESRRILDAVERTPQQSFVDAFLEDRANQSLGHVFTLLSLVLPSAPLHVAFRGLHTDDDGLRGTALEYLEGVLPTDIRNRLWPFLEEGSPRVRENRPRDEVLADLLQSNESIVLKLEELRRRSWSPKRVAVAAADVPGPPSVPRVQEP